MDAEKEDLEKERQPYADLHNDDENESKNYAADDYTLKRLFMNVERRF